MMNKLKSPTKIETIAGSHVTESGLTLVGVVSGVPLAALLPVLSNSLASGRHKKRVEEALAEISSTLDAQAEIVRNLTDSQYKLINEIVLTILQTTSAPKLKYLRNVVQNGLQMPELEHQEATVLSRIIRDISAEEVDFLVRNFSYKKIQLGITTSDSPLPEVLRVSADGRDELIVSGLMSLGLVITAGPTIGDSGLFKFSSGVAKLIALLKPPSMNR